MRQLGQLEATVMDRLWAWDRPVLVREVLEVLENLQRDREIAYTTVMTVMEHHLYRKGLVGRERDGRAYRYTPAQTREEHDARVHGGGACLQRRPVSHADGLRPAHR